MPLHYYPLVELPVWVFVHHQMLYKNEKLLHQKSYSLQYCTKMMLESASSLLEFTPLPFCLSVDMETIQHALEGSHVGFQESLLFQSQDNGISAVF